MHAVSRRLAITAALASVGVTGDLSGRWLARPQSAARAALPAHPNPRLFSDAGDPVLGNPAGQTPIAEFYDYRCPYCRRMHSVINQLLQDDHDIRFIAKNWPILGAASEIAARVALAANWQGRFAAVHEALFSVPGKLDEPAIRDVAASAGVDLVRLDHDMAQRADELDAVLGDAMLDAASLGLQGTPAFVIGPYLVPGALSYDDLRGLVAKVRTKQHPA